MSVTRLGLESDQPNAYPSNKFNKRELKLKETIEKNRNLDLDFARSTQPIMSGWDKNAGAPLPAEAAAGQEIAFLVNGEQLELHNAVVESTGTAVYSMPTVSADGLELPLDADVTNGPTALEVTAGISAESKAAFTVGTDEKFYLEATIKIDDISDLEEMFLGFRKAEAYQADPDSYDEMAAWHVGETGATVADGQLNLATILNNAATTYTDTTEADWADGNEKTLRVEVDGNGKVTFKVDGAEPAATVAFSFDSGEVVVPFLFVDNTSGSSTGDPGVSVSSLKCGKL